MTPMTPDILTIPIMPESRLKAVVQANALLHAIICLLCIGFREQVTHHVGLPSLLFALVFGFSFAFHALFLFRVSVKEPISRRVVSLAAAVDVIASLTIVFIIVSHIFKYTSVGLRGLCALSAAQMLLGVGLLLLTNLSSSHSYSQTQVVTL